MENNTIVKITDGANRSTVTVMENIPLPPYARPTIADNKRLKELRRSLAGQFFQRLEQQHQSNLALISVFCSEGSPKHEQAKQNCERQSQHHQNSFIAAYQRAVMNSGGSRYTNSNYKKRQGERTRQIWDIVKCNFDCSNTVYATLTFDPNQVAASDLDTVKHEFRNFIIRFRKQYDNLLYIATYAMQKNGNWHFHLLFNAVGITAKKLKAIWGKGSIKLSRPQSNTDINHITKYLIKNMLSNQELLKEKKGYLYSRGLKRSSILKSWKSEQADTCLDRLEELRNYSNKFPVFNTTRSAGAIVRLEYPDSKTQDVFLTRDEIDRAEGALEIVEKIDSTITSVRVYHHEGDGQFIKATPTT